MSLRSSIYDYMEENGRTYHAFNSGKYMLPNDEREQDRLDLQHHSFRIMLDGKLHLAPLANPQRVLDIATGTGIWAIEFAQEYPEAVVIGTDLSPIQPGYVPPNCQFQVDDAEEEWTFREPFDYIHARAIVTCFKNNKTMAQKIFDGLAPGGYFELQDPSFPMKCDDGTLEGTALEEWNTLLIESMTRIGRNLLDTHNWAQHLHDAGFIDIVEHKLLVPVNPWARGKKNKLLGAISLQNMTEGVASMSTAAFTRILGWSQERLEVFLVRVRDDLRSKGVHAYGVVYFITARKPLE
ncbi:S-adenosyl-L-methionine-dependent methyltransferase [Mollisia scopiformis]|uniref:S-adenosyl-L-methionine-dependent methyltransferase n=1 Tax=Mollisia scopiformis TaxID=149040 RepID=A0A194WY95_MOLSC|nr:S-adenosyl-L-methionine-dependent methyltransferase [Mollisia scopiformis]KUJ12577.1 S-adenosyl-L-methionine-dependent methyltransferase [Mollisia scopiformis]